MRYLFHFILQIQTIYITSCTLYTNKIFTNRLRASQQHKDWLEVVLIHEHRKQENICQRKNSINFVGEVKNVARFIYKVRSELATLEVQVEDKTRN